MTTQAERLETTIPRTTQEHIALVDRYSSRNYAPLPVVVAEGEGCWVTDVEGKRYLDLLSAYSALNFGHRHPALVAAAKEQLDRLTLTSRAFHNDQLGPFLRDLAELCEMDLALPMNSGAEAVETALKTARKWGYEVKGVAADRATVIVCDRNFHGRTITAISFSSDPGSKENFGPLTPGFRSVPFGDADSLEAAIDDDTVAFLVEPIQGEAGVIIPPDGYLRRVRDICTARNVLLIADEIQTGLGRTGHTFAVEHEGVRPDMLLLGKALGGGIIPVSAVVADEPVLGVFKPGQHGSTFGGNPIAAAIGRRVIQLLRTGELQENSRRLGDYLAMRFREAALPAVEEARIRGLWAGVQLVPEARPARAAAERLLETGVLAKDTHESTIRIAPPLVIAQDELDWGLERIFEVLSGLPAA
ncbi:MAG TPA: ornithine--oxo-acid transaminase [Actinomycetota bacterium]|nr:ornithine--oxo-acid transaminase [Actinomycetota bacterium]